MSNGYITIARASDPRVEYGIAFHVKHIRELPMLILDFLVSAERQHGFPMKLVMPCGNAIVFDKPEDFFPVEDIACKCGNVEHTPIRYFVEPWKDLDGRN